MVYYKRVNIFLSFSFMGEKWHKISENVYIYYWKSFEGYLPFSVALLPILSHPAECVNKGHYATYSHSHSSHFHYATTRNSSLNQ